MAWWKPEERRNSSRKKNSMRITAQIFGWLFTILGGSFAVGFGLLSLFYFGLGPYGIIIAIYMAGPLCLIGIAAFAFGRFLLKRARLMKPSDDSSFYSPAFPATQSLSQEKEQS
jgi:hypothetical protein